MIGSLMVYIQPQLQHILLMEQGQFRMRNLLLSQKTVLRMAMAKHDKHLADAAKVRGYFHFI